MSPSTDDLRIARLEMLSPPSQVIGEAPSSFMIDEMVEAARAGVHNILHGDDDRLVVIIGPCSIHDPKAALEYAGRLAAERRRHEGELEILMRVYFEKPRTTVGWKGLINDPGLDDSFHIEKGILLARERERRTGERRPAPAALGGDHAIGDAAAEHRSRERDRDRGEHPQVQRVVPEQRVGESEDVGERLP